MIQPIALISPVANPLLVPASAGDGAAFAQTFDRTVASMLDTAELPEPLIGQSAAVSGKPLPQLLARLPITDLATTTPGLATDPAMKPPQVIDAIATAAVPVPKGAMASVRTTAAIVGKSPAIANDLLGEQPPVDTPSLPLAQPQPTRAGASLPRPIMQPSRPVFRPGRAGLENDLVEADDIDAPAAEPDTDRAADPTTGLTDPPRGADAMVPASVPRDAITAVVVATVSPSATETVEEPTLVLAASAPDRHIDRLAAAVPAVSTPIPQTGKMLPVAAPTQPGELKVSGDESAPARPLIEEPLNVSQAPSARVIADAIVNPRSSLDRAMPKADASQSHGTEKFRTTRLPDRSRSSAAVAQDPGLGDADVDHSPESSSVRQQAVVMSSAEAVVVSEPMAEPHAVDAAQNPLPVVPAATTTAGTVPIAPATAHAAAPALTIGQRTPTQASTPTPAPESLAIPTTLMADVPATAAPMQQQPAVLATLPRASAAVLATQTDGATPDSLPETRANPDLAEPALAQIARIMPPPVAPVRTRPASSVTTASVTMPVPVTPTVSVESVPAIIPTPPPASRVELAPAAPIGTAEIGSTVPLSLEPTTALSSQTEPKSSPARPADTPVLTRIAAPQIAESQPIAAGATAPAFRLFAAAIHAAQLDEGDQRALSAPLPTTPVEHVRGLMPATASQGAPLDMMDHRWPQGVIDRIEHLRDSVSAANDAASTSIRLVPDALGAIDVSVRREGETVHVHFAAEQTATRTLLAEAQPRLTELAEAKGIKLAQGDVSTGSQPQGHTAGQNPTRDQPPSTPLSRAPAPAARDEDPDTTTTRVA